MGSTKRRLKYALDRLDLYQQALDDLNKSHEKEKKSYLKAIEEAQRDIDFYNELIQDGDTS